MASAPQSLRPTGHGCRVAARRPCLPPRPRSAGGSRRWRSAPVSAYPGDAEASVMVRGGSAVLLSAAILAAGPALAELNKYEAAAGGEFGIGTAQQYGEADLKGRSFSNQDLTRSNFTAADCRQCKFKNSKLFGAYFIKSVLFEADFENADLSDVLMDRAVLVKSNLKNANLQRAILTRSDLTDAIIEGADFSNALVDRPQQMVLCKYANGKNTVTGMDTRKSLGCSSSRRFREMSPSSTEGSQVTEAARKEFTKTIPKYRE